MSLVFGIGLNKTGTTSLHEALTILGYRSLHWGGPPVRRRIEAAIVERRPLLDGLDEQYDAFSDVLPLARHFALADEQYPGARFILTLRDEDAWVDSRRRHVERNRAKAQRGLYDGTFLTIDPDGWRTEWRTHITQVRDHFATRPGDLLTLDIGGGDGWEPLCAFLHRNVPVVDFPARNVDRSTSGDRS